MAQKYIMYGFDFHPEVVDFVKPMILDTFDEAVNAMYEQWQNEQNSYVLGTWFDGLEDEDEEVVKEREEEYRHYNYVEEGDRTARAISEGGGEFIEPQLLRVEPLNCKYVVLAATPGDYEYIVGIERESDSVDELYAWMFNDATAGIESPKMWAHGSCLHVWDDCADGPEDEHYYMLIEA